MISDDLPEVEINIPAGEFIRRDRFDSYECCFDVFPGQVFPLEQISICEKANANQLYTMRFRLKKNGASRMPSPGMSAMVTIKYKPEENRTYPFRQQRYGKRKTVQWCGYMMK